MKQSGKEKQAANFYYIVRINKGFGRDFVIHYKYTENSAFSSAYRIKYPTLTILLSAMSWHIGSPWLTLLCWHIILLYNIWCLRPDTLSPTGYASEEVQRISVFYDGSLYLYNAAGFDLPKEDRWQFLGKVAYDRDTAGKIAWAIIRNLAEAE